MSLSGDRIRELRLRHGLTLDDVARHLGIGRQAVYKYEQGTVTNIPLENLEKMAVLFGTTPGYLAGWSDDHPEDPPDTAPRTEEARILAKGIDQLPKAQREQALNVIRAMFSMHADYFTKGTDDDDT